MPLDTKKKEKKKKKRKIKKKGKGVFSLQGLMSRLSRQPAHSSVPVSVITSEALTGRRNLDNNHEARTNRSKLRATQRDAQQKQINLESKNAGLVERDVRNNYPHSRGVAVTAIRQVKRETIQQIRKQRGGRKNKKTKKR